MEQTNNNQKKTVAKRCVKPSENPLMEQAEQGNPRAQVKLGIWYENTMEDPDEASKWYKAAAERGYAQAQYLLGLYYYENGYGEDKSMRKAGKWFRKADGTMHKLRWLNGIISDTHPSRRTKNWP